MTTRVKGFRWHRREIDDYGIDFRHESDPRLDEGETLVDTPSPPSLEIIRVNADGSIDDVVDEFNISGLAIDSTDSMVVFRKGAAAVGEQDAGTYYQLLVLVHTSAGRLLASAHSLEVVEAGDPDAP